MVIKGKNSEIIYNNERYHIQTESWAPAENVLVTQIFKGGQVLLKKKFKGEMVNNEFDEEIVLRAHELAIEEFKDLLI